MLLNTTTIVTAGMGLLETGMGNALENGPSSRKWRSECPIEYLASLLKT